MIDEGWETTEEEFEHVVTGSLVSYEVDGDAYTGEVIRCDYVGKFKAEPQYLIHRDNSSTIDQVHDPSAMDHLRLVKVRRPRYA